jgi:hypothetical protein
MSNKCGLLDHDVVMASYARGQLSARIGRSMGRPLTRAGKRSKFPGSRAATCLSYTSEEASQLSCGSARCERQRRPGAVT